MIKFRFTAAQVFSGAIARARWRSTISLRLAVSRRLAPPPCFDVPADFLFGDAQFVETAIKADRPAAFRATRDAQAYQQISAFALPKIHRGLVALSPPEDRRENQANNQEHEDQGKQRPDQLEDERRIGGHVQAGPSGPVLV